MRIRTGLGFLVLARFLHASRYPHRSKTLQSDGSIMRRTIAIAAAGLSLAGCSSLSLDAFKPGPPTVQVQLEFDPAGSRRPHLRRSWLQDALLGRGDGPGHRILRDLHLEQVPAGYHSGAARPRRSRVAGHRRPEPGGCRAAASGSAAQTGSEKGDEAEKAETAQQRSGACRRLSIPRPAASPGGRRSAGRPVIAALHREGADCIRMS